MPVQPTNHQPSHQHSFRCNCSMSSAAADSFSHVLIQLSSHTFPMTHRGPTAIPAATVPLPFYIPGADLTSALSLHCILHLDAWYNGIIPGRSEAASASQQHQLGQQQQLQFHSSKLSSRPPSLNAAAERQQQSHTAKASPTTLLCLRFKCPDADEHLESRRAKQSRGYS